MSDGAVRRCTLCGGRLKVPITYEPAFDKPPLCMKCNPDQKPLTRRLR